MFALFARHVSPPPGTVSPLLWGNLETVQQRLQGAARVTCQKRIARLHYPFNVPETVEFFRRYFGPTQRAFASLDPEGQAALRKELEALHTQWNTSETPNETEARAEYLEVRAER